MKKLWLVLVITAVGFPQTSPQFEVATVRLNKSGSPASRAPGAKNGRFTAENVPLKTLLSYAYGVLQFQTTGPAWIESDRYDITATLPEGAEAAQAPAMLRALLEERFKMETHREKVEQSVYALLVDKAGAKFLDTHPDTPFTPHFPEGHAVKITNGTVAHFGEFLSGDVGRPVVDHTGIEGQYRLLLTYVTPKADGAAAVPGPDIFTALREELGLRLEARKEAVEMLRVDRAERLPSEN